MNSYKISVKEWVAKTNAVGLRATTGRYGGTYAHKDIAFEFGMWISPEFKIYLIKEFQRLKEDESRRLSLDWNLNRALSKLNYRIHTDVIKANLIPATITPVQAGLVYASESDVLNVALFGQTAKQWLGCESGTRGQYARIQRDAHPTYENRYLFWFRLVRFRSYSQFIHLHKCHKLPPKMNFHLADSSV